MLKEFELYLMDEGKADNTIRSYLLHVECYFKWFKGTFGAEPDKLYRQNILEYKSFLQNIKQESAKTINAKLAALVKLNEFLQEQSVQPDLVVSKKDYIRVQSEMASPSTVNKNDVEAFRQKVLQSEGNRNFAIITVLAYCGLRISECLDLKLNDINLTAKEITVKSGKGSKQRLVYINSKIVEAVKEYLKERKEVSCDYLFVSNKGNKIDRTVINKMFNKYSDKITPHTLRHFYCSNALESGFSIHEVSNQAGHSNVHTTLLYTNPDREKMKNKAELL